MISVFLKSMKKSSITFKLAALRRERERERGNGSGKDGKREKERENF